MKQIRLVRIAEWSGATYGVLLFDGMPGMFTLEEPWRDNQRSISRIPSGQYTCARVVSPRFGDTFEIQHVPGRSHILFHAGNTTDDTEGCVLLGMSYGVANGKPAVLASQRAFAQFREWLSGQAVFDLAIFDPPPP